jgi:hypothetical protein
VQSHHVVQHYFSESGVEERDEMRREHRILTQTGVMRSIGYISFWDGNIGRYR